jgi:hypothetical protein
MLSPKSGSTTGHVVALGGWCMIAVIDVVSRQWLSSVVSAQEASTQVDVAVTRALLADGKDHWMWDV